MEGNRVLSVAFCVVLFGSIDATLLTVGPKETEKGTYVYRNYSRTPVSSHHCLYCPEGAFYNTSMNILTQEPECISKYKDLKKEIKPSELESSKIPICKVGEVPSCGPPPEGKVGGYTWACDPGYSNVNYSVYFSCALICGQSGKVLLSYYCSEDLRWELSANFSDDHPRVILNNDYSSALKTALIAVCVVGSVCIFLLVGCTVWICKRKPRDPRHIENDSEASVAFMTAHGTGNTGHKCLECNCPQENVKLRSGSTDSGISAGSDVRGKKEIKQKERQPPYGEERPETSTSNVDAEVQTSRILLDHLSTQHTGKATGSHSKQSAINNKMKSKSMSLDKRREGKVVESNRPARNTTTDDARAKDDVRGEIDQSSIENARNCQHLLYKKPPISSSKIVAVSPMAVSRVGQKTPTKKLNAVPKEKPLAGKRMTDRPNPLGNNSVTTYTESGDFDDENDQRHNTNRKEFAASGVAEESQESTLRDDYEDLSSSEKRGAEFNSNEQNHPHCAHVHACSGGSATEDSDDLSVIQTENWEAAEQPYDIDEEVEESFEIDIDNF